jgi:TolB protein
MGNDKQRKTFLSYSRANKDFAIKLAKELKSEGFYVWLDQLDIPAGARWDREVERALKESEIFMIILTQASVDSENVLDEIGYAIDNRKRFLPVLLENCDVPLRLRRFQYVDFTTKSFDEGVESAKELLRSLIAQTTIPQVKVSADAQDQSGQAEREAKAETERKAKEDADSLAIQKAETDRLALQRAEEERLAKAKADRKVKEDHDAKAEAERLAQQKAEEERKAKEKVVPIAVSVAPAQRKPASKGLLYGGVAVVLLVIAGVAFSVFSSGGNKNSPATTLTAQEAVVAPAIEAAETPTIAPTPIGGGGGKIAFVSDRDGNSEIYIMNANGSGVTRLTNNSAVDTYPDWSPDGKHIAFESNREDPDPANCNPCNYKIYIMNADGSGVTRLTNNSASDYVPAWSPDGKHIAFHSKRDGNREIYIMNADGSGQTRLTSNTAEDYEAKWSPDGKHIAFYSTRDDPNPDSCDNICKTEIYIMNTDGSGVTRLTNNSDFDESPVWSPDGKYIAFDSTQGDPDPAKCSSCFWNIYIMNADGSVVTPLTNNSGNNFYPAWSPDGKHIAFSSERDDPNRSTCSDKCNYDIYIMNADGSGVTRLTNNSASDTLPVWQP